MSLPLNDLSILIKYIDDEYMENFKSGEIHFTQLKYFRDKETIGGNKTIGDKNEGHVIRRYSSDQISKLIITPHEGKEKPLKDYDVSGDLGNNRFGHALEYNTTSKDTDFWGISCFTILRFLDPEVFSSKEKVIYSCMENEFYKTYDFKLRKKFIDKLYYDVGGKNRSPIILFPPLLNKLKEFKSNSNLPVFYSPVTYYSDYDQSNVDLNSDWDRQVMQAAFTKSNHYKNQKEFRIILFCDVRKIGSNINVGNLDGCYMNCKGRKPSFSLGLKIKLYTKYSSRYAPFLKTRFKLQRLKLNQLT